MTTTINYRHADDGLAEIVSAETALSFRDAEDKAVQSGKEDADINVIVRRFGVTGQVPVPSTAPFFGDFEAYDYQGMLNQVIEAQSLFDAMPSGIRDRFQNDPAQLIEFLRDKDNEAEARELGLLNPVAAEPVPVRVRVVPEEPATS